MEAKASHTIRVVDSFTFIPGPLFTLRNSLSFQSVKQLCCVTVERTLSIYPFGAPETNPGF